MHYNDMFRKVVEVRFDYKIKKSYLPDQKFINRLIASLSKIEVNSYDQSDIGFVSEYIYYEKIDILLSVDAFVSGCLNQLLWINTILESDISVTDKKELNERFDYQTPTTTSNHWTLDKVTKKGVYFRGDGMNKDSRVIINSENIIKIAIALSTVNQHFLGFMAAKKRRSTKSEAKSGSQEMGLTLFKSKDLETKCLNVLKEIKHPVLDSNGHFLNGSGMKGAIVVWYHKCKALGLISSDFSNTRDEIAKEVMNIIPKLSIESSNFSRDPMANKFKKDIEHKLTQLARK